jgi:tRNA G18 (ribose-2'-O)-methylase SpoU
VEEEEDEETK